MYFQMHILKGIGIFRENSFYCNFSEKRQISPPAEKIAFTSYLDHPIKTLQKDQAINYNQVLLNDGNGYDSTTGK